jgi:hypothetical protein
MLSIIGAVLCTAMGLLGVLAPYRAAKLVSIEPVGGLGVSEIRATYGGVFRSPDAYLIAGASWLGAGLLRFPSLVLDKGSFPKALGGAALELTIGILLLSGADVP